MKDIKEQILDIEKNIKSHDERYKELDAKKDIIRDHMNEISNRNKKLRGQKEFLERTNVWSKVIDETYVKNAFEKECLELMNQAEDARKYNFTSSDLRHYYTQIQSVRSACFHLMKHVKQQAEKQEGFEKSGIYFD
jgi:phage shock protein A